MSTRFWIQIISLTFNCHNNDVNELVPTTYIQILVNRTGSNLFIIYNLYTLYTLQSIVL